MTKCSKLILFLIFTLMVSAQGVRAIDEQALCTGSHYIWDSARFRCTIFETGHNAVGENFRYEVQYPTRVMDETFIQNAIRTMLENQINIFMGAVNTSTTSGTPLTEWSLSVNYDVFEFDSSVFSVVFHTEENTGGAHPNYYVDTITFDRAHDGILNLQDLFITGSDPLQLIVPFVRNNLEGILGNDPSIVQGIEGGTQPNYDNFKAFAVTHDALIFFFPPYQVAPFAAGGFTVRMPLSLLNSIWQIGDHAHPVTKG